MSDSWESFGYETEQPCCVCGTIPAKIEPRFGYIVCEEHHTISPARIYQLVSLPKELKNE